MKEDQIKVLAPTEVPGELARLKSKADIKAEIHRRVSNGRPVVFRGVIRNGKLIEQLRSQHFVPVDTVEAPDCGVRLWWSGNSDGFIFFRYSTIEKIALTGLLTDAEREEILRRLRARDDEKDPAQAAEEAAQKTEEELSKLPEEQLKAVLIDRYPYEDGWNPERRHQLKLKQVRNEKLTPDETIFLKYYHVLRKARFEELKRRSEKTEIEPGSADDEPSGSGSNRSAGE